MQKLVPRGPNAIFPYIIREITGTNNPTTAPAADAGDMLEILVEKRKRLHICEKCKS